MRVAALVILLCMASGVVRAQTTEQCQPTQRAGELLACYNKTAPPHALGKPKVSSFDCYSQARSIRSSNCGR